MRIQTWRRLPIEELGEMDARTRHNFELLLAAINPQIENLTTALQRKLNFGDNFNGEVATVRVKHNKEISYRLKSARGPVKDAWITYPGRYSAASLAWAVVDQNNLVLKVTWPDTPAGEFDVRLILLGA